MSNVPTIVVMRGLPASGKTSLAHALGRSLRVAVVSKDDVYDPLAAVVDDPALVNRVAYEVVRRLVIRAIAAGAPLILDLGLNHRGDAEAFMRWIADSGGRAQAVLCECADGEEWERRLARRREQPLPNQRLVDPKGVRRHYAGIPTGNLCGELVVDTSLPLPLAVQKLQQALDADAW